MVLSYYNIQQNKVTKKEAEKYIKENFSYRQRFYINYIDEGYIENLVKMYLNCQDLKRICENNKEKLMNLINQSQS